MLEPFVLEGRRVRLEPLALEHVPLLAAAAAQDRSTYAFTWVPDGVQDTRRYVEAALEHQQTGRALAWAVRLLAENRIVGSTRFLDLEVFSSPPPWPPGVGRGGEPGPDHPPSVGEIGGTWFAASVQRTGVNSEVKFLQLAHAFEVWQVLRITFKTDARNHRSRRAIEGLGARFEGVRRAHSPATDGSVRDTAYFSVLREEWPTVRTALRRRLGWE